METVEQDGHWFRTWRIHYITLHEFVKAVRNKTQTPIDVYDATTWSAIIPLSEQSVASRGAPVDFPDFTKGKWRTAKPITLE